jgi:predicted DNA repair protein MutK
MLSYVVYVGYMFFAIVGALILVSLLPWILYGLLMTVGFIYAIFGGEFKEQ